MNNTIKGALAGFGATLPMTFTMSNFHQKLPITKRSGLPPRQIMMWLSDKLGLKKKLDETGKTLITLLGHFSFGALAGMLFQFLPNKYSMLLRGQIFGVIVWVSGYVGILPLLKYDSSAFKLPVEKNLLMLFAHFVWGLSLAVIYRMLSGDILLSGFTKRITKASSPL